MASRNHMKHNGTIPLIKKGLPLPEGLNIIIIFNPYLSLISV
jgi:hypothetical protein